jgi:hypothetical protein
VVTPFGPAAPYMALAAGWVLVVGLGGMVGIFLMGVRLIGVR